MSFEAAFPTVFKKIKTMPYLPVMEHDQWGRIIMGRLSENCLNKSCIPQGSIPRSLWGIWIRISFGLWKTEAYNHCNGQSTFFFFFLVWNAVSTIFCRRFVPHSLWLINEFSSCNLEDYNFLTSTNSILLNLQKNHIINFSI